MNSYKHSLINTLNFLNELKIDDHYNALWDVLHSARWHEGIDWLMWIEQNKELIAEVKGYTYISDCPNKLLAEVRKSILAIKELK